MVCRTNTIQGSSFKCCRVLQCETPARIRAAMVGPQVGLLFANGMSLEQPSFHKTMWEPNICNLWGAVRQPFLEIYFGSHYIPLKLSKVIFDSWSTPQRGFWWLQCSHAVHHHSQANTSFMMEHWQLVCNRGAWMFLGIREGLGDRLIQLLDLQLAF